MAGHQAALIEGPTPTYVFPASDIQLTVGEVLDALEGRPRNEPVSFIAHTPEECCDGHTHDITELVPEHVEVISHGEVTFHLRELHA